MITTILISWTPSEGTASTGPPNPSSILWRWSQASCPRLLTSSSSLGQTFSGPAPPTPDCSVLSIKFLTHRNHWSFYIYFSHDVEGWLLFLVVVLFFFKDHFLCINKSYELGSAPLKFIFQSLNSQYLQLPIGGRIFIEIMRLKWRDWVEGLILYN